MGNFQITMMDGGIADAGETQEVARLKPRPRLLSRRSFLFSSAVGLGALGLAGCATSDGISLAEAAKIYGPVPQRNSRSRRSMSARWILNIIAE